MLKNISDFNSCVANIMGKLYENFPKQIQLSANEFPTFNDFVEDDSEEEKHRKVKEGYELYVTYFHTALFLLDEGFIRGTRSTTHTVIDDCVLTSKGLAKLQRVPKSIQDKTNSLSVGELFSSLGKEVFKATASETVKAGIGVLLSNR
ncbi:hypothetical protein KTE62_18805 [Burkholderia multivorans]|uniref:hypothetical protein n=1 Tax=Burkholderia multivorans TaxID=87883 RepID=UPI001C22EBF2|nr:hypothetical protein [Burkholderia multivorans]MBU9443773.1 hypothetical protein [Burkholderia multivorans]